MGGWVVDVLAKPARRAWVDGWMGRGEAARRQCSGQFAIIHVAMLRPSFRVIRRSLPVELWGKIPLIEIYGDH
jgi:hypothetical protein